MDTYRSALSDLGDVGLGLGCFGRCGSLLGGSGLGCSLGCGLLGRGSLLSRSLLCSGLVDISMRAMGIQTLQLTVFLALAAAVFGAALVAVLVSVFLVSAFLVAGGEPALPFAIFTGPEAPIASQNRVEPLEVLFPDPERMDEKMLTLGALENTCLATLGKSAVELGGESGICHAREVVVGLDVFLECLTAVRETSQ